MSITICEKCERRFDSDNIDNIDNIDCYQEGQCPVTDMFNFNDTEVRELNFNDD